MVYRDILQAMIARFEGVLWKMADQSLHHLAEIKQKMGSPAEMPGFRHRLRRTGRWSPILTNHDRY